MEINRQTSLIQLMVKGNVSSSYVQTVKLAYLSACLYVCLFAFDVRAQQLSAVVYDMETLRHVPGVKVYINPKGSTVTDNYGRFSVSDSCNGVTLSHGTYESLRLDKSEIHDTIWLMPKTRRLDEVVVTARRPRPGFDIKAECQKVLMTVPRRGGISFDFFQLFRHKERKQTKRRKEIKKMLDKY